MLRSPGDVLRNPYESPRKVHVTVRSLPQTMVHYCQFVLGCFAILFLIIWLGLLTWEILYHQILISDYFSGFLSWAVILAFVRRAVIFVFARPGRSSDG